MYFYATMRTIEFAKSHNPRVYLYGSAEGYSNFGDTLQLKSAVSFHQQTGGPAPVVVIALSSVVDAAHVAKFESWYGVDHIIFTSREPLDAVGLGLNPVLSIARGGYLHLYGGGYLNGIWGAGRLEFVEYFLTHFQIEAYVMSGLQIDADIVPRLDAVFAIREPALFGLRDPESVTLAKQTSAPDVVRFSFDDVIEPVLAWRRHLLGADDEPPVGRRGEFALHLNVTGEYTSGHEQVLGVQSALDTILTRYPNHGVAIVQAYDDKREIVRDSLPALKDFDAFFPYDEFRVVNTAKMALDLDAVEECFPGSPSTFALDFAIVSSYHTALIMHLLGVPAFLFSLNDYYRQKAEIFELPDTVEEFLGDPSLFVKDFSPELAERESWIAELQQVVEGWSTEPLSRRVKLNRPVPAKRGEHLTVFPGKYV